jgi:hypothetical protein
MGEDMGDKSMKQPKGVFRTALAAVLALGASQAHAVVTFEAMGGELEVEGSLTSTVRVHTGSGETYLGQWLQRLQIEAGLNYDNVGWFDKLSFVTVVRPEYDVAYDLGDLSNGHFGQGATKPSNVDRSPFNYKNEGLAFGGFDAFYGPGSFKTGGIGKIVEMGFENPSWLAKNFEVDFSRSPMTHQRIQFTGKTPFGGGGVNAPGGGFPFVVQKSSNLHLDCKHCPDLNLSPLDVALDNTTSNGRLYPFRELYADAVAGDFWFRVGKQQIVWGKTDFFRLQDIINPMDFGQHFFFDSFEDIRIPQWMASAQWKFGSFGPLTDNAVQIVWNFDRFQGVGLGNPSEMWAHPFSKDISTFGIFNTFFSPEPCVNAKTVIDNPTTMKAADVCGAYGPNDNRKASGFGALAGIDGYHMPGYKIGNTEAGARWEFRVSDWRIAISHWYGFNDAPVFRFHEVNTIAALTPQGVAGTNDLTIADLTLARHDQHQGVLNGLYSANSLAASDKPSALVHAARLGAFSAATNPGALGGAVPIIAQTPQQAARALMQSPVAAYRTAARNAAATGDFSKLWAATDPALAKHGIYSGGGPVLGGQASAEYKQAHTLGLSFDYFEQYTGTVWRVESSWTFDELVMNTKKVDWRDTSDVMRWSIGIDRPTFLKWLNKDRTFFLSLQMFDTWYMDHDGDKHTGMLNDTHNFITTFFFIGNYMRDRLKPVGFIVWEEASNSWVSGLNLEWLMDNHWSVKGGLHTIWGGTNNTLHDTGPFTTFVSPGSDGNTYPYVFSNLGIAHQGLGVVRNYDEIFFELKYQF